MFNNHILVQDQFHNQHVALWLLLAALLTFIISAILAYCYQNTIQKIVYRGADRFGEQIQRKLKA